MSARNDHARCREDGPQTEQIFFLETLFNKVASSSTSLYPFELSRKRSPATGVPRLLSTCLWANQSFTHHKGVADEIHKSTSSCTITPSSRLIMTCRILEKCPGNMSNRDRKRRLRRIYQKVPIVSTVIDASAIEQDRSNRGSYGGEDDNC